MNPQQAEKLKELLGQSTVWWIGLVLAFVVLAALVHRVHAWYRDGADPADDPDEIVRQMEELNRQGDLTDEEIRSIKNQFSARKNR